MVSVTKLIDILNKPALLNWSNKLGLKGLSLKENQLKSKTKGINNHNNLELFFTEGIYFKGCEKFQEIKNKYIIISCEQPINNGYILGRIDMIVKNKLTKEIGVVDFKSSKGIYLSTKIQLSAYKEMYKADKMFYVNIEDGKMIELKVDSSIYWNILKSLYKINELLKINNDKL